MNEKIKELALQTGGSHYPGVNSELLEMFANMIIDECVDAVKTADMKQIVFTTFDAGMVKGVKERCVNSINERFKRGTI
jgi:hypothetical protein